MPFFQSIPNSLQDLGTALSSITNGSDVYFYKDNTGAIQAYNTEHPLSTSNFGYPFQFIDGTVSYTAITITNLNQIPWTFPYTTLTASNSNLWNSSLMIWIDALEPKAISNSLQKVVSKDYTNNLIIVDKNAKDTRSDKTKIVMSSDNVKHLDIKNIIKFLIKNVKIKKISKIY